MANVSFELKSTAIWSYLPCLSCNFCFYHFKLMGILNLSRGEQHPGAFAAAVKNHVPFRGKKIRTTDTVIIMCQQSMSCILKAHDFLLLETKLSWTEANDDITSLLITERITMKTKLNKLETDVPLAHRLSEYTLRDLEPFHWLFPTCIFNFWFVSLCLMNSQRSAAN